MSTNWSRDDCLNHVADSVAGGLTDFDIDCEYNFIELRAEDIIESLVLSESWTLNMKDEPTLILAGLHQQIDNWRLVAYLKKREEYRAELIIPRPPRWTDITPALAAQIYSLPNSSLLHASHSVKLIWDKHWHKGNQAKGAKSVEENEEEAKCPLCDGSDSQQQWIRECQAEPLPGTRKDYIALVKGSIKRHRDDRH